MDIAICDDEEVCRRTLISKLESIDHGTEKSAITEFACGGDLMEATDSGKRYDLVFMDIEMPGLNGIDTAKHVSRSNAKTVFVFLTVHEQYVFHSFSVLTFDYLIKPLDESRLRKAYGKFLSVYRKSHIFIEAAWKNTVRPIDIHDIVYIESFRRHTLIHTKESDAESSVLIGDYAKQLSSDGFFMSHQGILVNLKYVESVERSSIRTTVGITLYMSVRKKQECLNALNRYITERHYELG
ncbi:MAG: LytR/AlgR family response regulator transcription factor [Saccharofermentanales bacterium]